MKQADERCARWKRIAHAFRDRERYDNLVIETLRGYISMQKARITLLESECLRLRKTYAPETL